MPLNSYEEVANYLRRTKKLLSKMMWEEVSKYVYDPSEVEDELKVLSSVEF